MGKKTVLSLGARGLTFIEKRKEKTEKFKVRWRCVCFSLGVGVRGKDERGGRLLIIYRERERGSSGREKVGAREEIMSLWWVKSPRRLMRASLIVASPPSSATHRASISHVGFLRLRHSLDPTPPPSHTLSHTHTLTLLNLDTYLVVPTMKKVYIGRF